MNGPMPDARATARPNGLIDTIQAGFNAVNRNIWLLLLPLLIDIGLWLGPQVTVGPALERFLSQLTPPPGANGELVQAVEQGRRSSIDLVERDPAINRFNLVSLVVVPILGVPSFQAGAPGQGPAVPVESLSAAATTVAVAMVVGLCVAAAFYGLMGQAVRDGRAAPTRFVAEFGPILIWTAALFVLVVLVITTVGLPLGLLLLAARGTAPSLAAVIGPVIIGVLLWAFVYLFFTTDALFVSQVPPLIAARQSILVVRTNFWSTLGFILLILVISAGLPILWNEIAGNLRGPGIAVAMLGHIYISSGLAAASMTYYKERFERLTERIV